MSESEPGAVVPLPSDFEETPAVYRHGLGYRGVWRRQGIIIEFNQVRPSHADLTGLLTVRYSVSTPLVAKFNVAALTTRASLCTHLSKTTTFKGWSALLDRFCTQVLELASAGTDGETIGGGEPFEVTTEYLLDPLLPLGTPAMIFGPPGVHKSTLATFVACSVQTGLGLLEGWQPQQRNVLVLDWEASRKEWHKRLCMIAKGAGVPPPLIQYRKPRGPLVSQIEWVSREIAEHQIGLVIVDSMMPALGSQREGGDASDTSTRFFEALNLLDCTALLVGQVRGDLMENGDKPSKPYGSVNQMYETRSLWELRAETESDHEEVQTVVLSHRKVNDGPKRQPIALRVIHGPTTILVEHCEVPPELAALTGSLHQRVCQVLKRVGKPLHRSEIALQVGVDRQALRVVIHRSRQLVRLDDDRVGLLAWGVA